MTQSELYTYARRLVGANATDWTEADLVVDLNDALSDVWTRLKIARGVLEFDDTNYTDLPASTFSLAANDRYYKILSDDDDNQIVVVHKVQVQNGTNWVDLKRQMVGEGNQDVLLNTATASIPSAYFEMGATLVLDPIPSTARTCQIWFSRAPKYFESGGSLTPGIPLMYHKLLAEKAAFTYAVSKGKNSQQSINALVQMGERRIDEFEENRRDDEATVMTVTSLNGI